MFLFNQTEYLWKQKLNWNDAETLLSLTKSSTTEDYRIRFPHLFKHIFLHLKQDFVLTLRRYLTFFPLNLPQTSGPSGSVILTRPGNPPDSSVAWKRSTGRWSVHRKVRLEPSKQTKMFPWEAQEVQLYQNQNQNPDIQCQSRSVENTVKSHSDHLDLFSNLSQRFFNYNYDIFNQI